MNVPPSESVPAGVSVASAMTAWLSQANEAAALVASIIAAIAGGLAIYRHFKK